MNYKLTALVPMRDKSVRVPNKNIRTFGGEPLFFRILNTLQKSPSIEKIVVNTDSERIKSLIIEYFPNIIIIHRPSSLCAGEVPTNEIIAYDLERIDGDFFLQTHATNPLLTTDTINRAVVAFFEGLKKSYDSLVSVNVLKSRLYHSNIEAINHDPKVLLPTQDLPPVYEENSNLYMFTRQNFAKSCRRIGEFPFFFEMSKLESWDIDTEDDFQIAELIYQSLKKE